MPEQDYWKTRFEALNGSLLKEGMDFYDDAEFLFRRAQNSINKDIAAWYQRFADNNQITLQEAKKWLRGSELEEFRWTVDDYIRKGRENGISADWAKQLENASARFHISRLEALKVQMRQHLEELYGNYQDGLDRTMRSVYEDAYYRTAYTMQEGYHTGFEVAALAESEIDAVMRKPWAADGSNFSDRIWKDKAKLLSSMETELTQGLIRGDPQDRIVKKLAERMGVSRSNAARLVATESAFFAAKGELDNMKELGVEKYQFLATLDRKTSDVCRSMDMKIFPLTDFQPGVTAPPLHCYCRSCTVPYMGENAEGLRAARDEKGKTTYVPGEMSYTDWKAVYVDKKKTPEAWQEQYIFNFKKKVLEQAVSAAAEQYAQAEDALDSMPDKEYANIWRDPVSLGDWEDKKDRIQAKQEYFEQKIREAVSEAEKGKFEKLLDALKEFDKLGAEVSEKKKKLEEAEIQLENARIELEKHLNGGKIKENPYSAKRKREALWFDEKHGGFPAADKYFDPPAVKLHKAATDKERNGFYTYTAGSGGHNRPLAGFRKPYYEPGSGWEERYYVGPKKVWINYEGKGEAIRGLTSLISKSTYDKDVWLQSGQDFATLEGFLKIPYGSLQKMSDKELQQFVGHRDRIYNFLSTAVNEGGGGVFNRKPMKFNIYAPKGAQMLYASNAGAYGKGENEMILQRGAYYIVDKIYWGKDATDGGRKKLFVDLEIHIEKGYDTFQQDPAEWTGSTEDYKSK